MHLSELSAAVDGCVVHIHNVLTLLSIALEGCILHILDCILVRNDVGNLEECGLENGVCTSAEADLCCYLCRIDDVKLDVLLSDDGLYVVGDSVQCLFLVPERVEKQASAFLNTFHYVIFV